MRNRHELRNARRREAEAIASRKAIEALPRRRGQKVLWWNGVVWERTGDDTWQPGHAGEGWFTHQNGEPFAPSPSAHVASTDWTPYTEPATPAGDAP